METLESQGLMELTVDQGGRPRVLLLGNPSRAVSATLESPSAGSQLRDLEELKPGCVGDVDSFSQGHSETALGGGGDRERGSVPWDKGKGPRLVSRRGLVLSLTLWGGGGTRGFWSKSQVGVSSHGGVGGSLVPTASVK